jgi:hypothetical protein
MGATNTSRNKSGGFGTMTRSCFALTLLFLVLAGSLYAIRSAQGQTHLDARVGSARPGLCPLLGDEVHRCGFGPLAQPLEGLPTGAAAKRLATTQRLCPLAIQHADEGADPGEPARVEAEGVAVGWYAAAKQERATSADNRKSANRAEPPSDPYPLYSLLGVPVPALAKYAQYLSGHDAYYDSVVYGQPLPKAPIADLASLISFELAEACRRPLANVFPQEDAPDVFNYGYQPAQLDEGLGTRGAARALGQLPQKLTRRLHDSALLGLVQCHLADVSYRARRHIDTASRLADWSGSIPAQHALGRPLVTEQVTLGDELVGSSVESDRELASTGVEELGSKESAEAELTDGQLTDRRAVPEPRRILVRSLASSLDRTGRLLQNASRQLETLLDN